MATTTTTAATEHKPEPWYREAGSDKCPHGPEPEDRDSAAWDTWGERHVASPQDVYICLDAPMGDHCDACYKTHGEAVPWSACDARTHASLRPGAEAGPGHEAVEVWVGTFECLNRECEEYFDADGNEIPGKDRCSHIGTEVICGGCSGTNPDGYYEPTVAWPGPHAGTGSSQ